MGLIEYTELAIQPNILQKKQLRLFMWAYFYLRTSIHYCKNILSQRQQRVLIFNYLPTPSLFQLSMISRCTNLKNICNLLSQKISKCKICSGTRWT
ncbi:hypothetical protein FGO68_gene15893 [Halteria grandinella]|uniref:Uncharacterized protein n=1 Tax=Halteria grandinella TaxID=5974 RepID=A0A8J8SVQ7_HALGN|nr:hypothetical protein FGO68_gene15893 [Halteria grandinella]